MLYNYKIIKLKIDGKDKSISIGLFSPVDVNIISSVNKLKKNGKVNDALTILFKYKYYMYITIAKESWYKHKINN